MRIFTSGVIYMLIYIFVGLLVFQPLVKTLEPEIGPQYIAAFQPSNPMSILGFQVIRGIVWALLSAPIILAVKAPRLQKGLIIALTFALFMAPQNLIPNDLAVGIRTAHTAEVLIGNFAFGWLAVTLLDPGSKKESSEAVEMNIETSNGRI
jgi:hypothetical protein